MKKTLPLLLVGGGSGGHIYPLLAIAEHLIDHKNWSPQDLHFVMADNNADFRYLESTNFSYSLVSVAKLRRYFSWDNCIDFFKFFKNIIWAFIFLLDKKPTVIFSKGGFVSLPIGLAAFVLRIPFYLHETDSVMGLSNSLLSRIAKTVFTGFPSKNPKYIWVGNPVRQSFFVPVSALEEHSDTQEYKKLKVLIFGGSQGAHTLNEWGRLFFEEQKNIEVLIITGRGKKSEHQPSHITEVEFLTEGFVDAIHDADIVIARAGGSVSELAAAGKCVILVPLPSAANDHQRKNAEYFASKNAALWIEESDLYTDTTEKKIIALFSDPVHQHTLSKHLKLLASSDTVSRIVHDIWDTSE